MAYVWLYVYRRRVGIDGRQFEVEKVFDSRLDKEDDVFQEVSHC